MYLLKLECIGDNSVLNRVYGVPDRYYVYEIWFNHARHEIERKKLYPKKDYANANSVGSRGIYGFYFLENGKTYEVKSPISWGKSDCYFCRIEENLKIRMTAEETIKWLRSI